MFSPIQQARYIDVSISEFQKHAFESFLALVMFLDISFTILCLLSFFIVLIVMQLLFWHWTLMKRNNCFFLLFTTGPPGNMQL